MTQMSIHTVHDVTKKGLKVNEGLQPPQVHI